MDKLFAKILDMILYVKLTRLIGRKSENETGDWVLGRRVMKKAFVALSNLPEEKKWTTAWVTSVPTISQELIKKKHLKNHWDLENCASLAQRPPLESHLGMGCL